jgi:hypothetical protein
MSGIITPIANAAGSVVGGAANTLGNVANTTTGAVGSAFNNATNAVGQTFGSMLGYTNPAVSRGGYADPIISPVGYPSVYPAGYVEPAVSPVSYPASYVNTGVYPAGYVEPAVSPVSYPAGYPASYVNTGVYPAGYIDPAVTSPVVYGNQGLSNAVAQASNGNVAAVAVADGPASKSGRRNRRARYGVAGGFFGYRRVTPTVASNSVATSNNVASNVTTSNVTACNQSNIYTAVAPTTTATTVAGGVVATGAQAGCRVGASYPATTAAVTGNQQYYNAATTTTTTNNNGNTNEVTAAELACNQAVINQQAMAIIPSALPEPWASTVDIITASQYVEEAIHACDCKRTERNLSHAYKYLKYAHVYLESASTIYSAQSAVYQNLALQLITAMSELKHIKKHIPKSKHLKQYQQSVIYNYQGVLSSLYKQISALQ